MCVFVRVHDRDAFLCWSFQDHKVNIMTSPLDNETNICLFNENIYNSELLKSTQLWMIQSTGGEVSANDGTVLWRYVIWAAYLLILLYLLNNFSCINKI